MSCEFLYFYFYTGWRTAATTDHQGRHCSWEQGYHTQQIFLCITCMRRQMFSQARRRREELEQRPTKSRRTEQPAGNAGEHDPFDDYRAFPLAFCERCIHQCHQLRGHAVVNIGLKQNIRCDCGTRRMQVCMDGLDPNTCENYDTYTNSDHYCTLTPEKDELSKGYNLLLQLLRNNYWCFLCVFSCRR